MNHTSRNEFYTLQIVADRKMTPHRLTSKYHRAFTVHQPAYNSTSACYFPGLPAACSSPGVTAGRSDVSPNIRPLPGSPSQSTESGTVERTSSSAKSPTGAAAAGRSNTFPAANPTGDRRYSGDLDRPGDRRVAAKFTEVRPGEYWIRR